MEAAHRALQASSLFAPLCTRAPVHMCGAAREEGRRPDACGCTAVVRRASGEITGSLFVIISDSTNKAAVLVDRSAYSLYNRRGRPTCAQRRARRVRSLARRGRASRPRPRARRGVLPRAPGPSGALSLQHRASHALPRAAPTLAHSPPRETSFPARGVSSRAQAPPSLAPAPAPRTPRSHRPTSQTARGPTACPFIRLHVTSINPGTCP